MGSQRKEHAEHAQDRPLMRAVDEKLKNSEIPKTLKGFRNYDGQMFRKEVTQIDPRLVAEARKLKDHWLEQVNSGQYLPMGKGKYEISRQIGARVENVEPENTRHLPGEPKRLAA
jgi:hypothetical protein